MRPSTLERAIIAIALCLAAWCYIPALDGEFFWDDQTYITANRELDSWAGLERIWLEPEATPQYYPVVFSTFWVEHQAWGENPRGYRLANVLLHLINGILLFVLLSRLGVPGAALGVAIFLLHPIQVESVAWIVERKNLLSFGAGTVALIAWLRILEGPSGRRPLAVAIVVIASLVALLSKTTACVVPPLLLLVAWWRDPNGWRAHLATVIALTGAALALGMVTLSREYAQPLPDAIVDMPSLGGRLLIAARAVVFYAATFAWPFPLSIVYERWPVGATPAALGSLGVMCVAAAIGWQRRGALMAYASFVLLLAPALGFLPFDFQRFSFVADHFAYAAVAPVAALVATAVWPRLVSLRPWLRNVAGVAIVVLLVGLAALSRGQASVYATQEGLWRRVIAVTPTAWIAYTNLGALLDRRGDRAEAESLLREAIRLQPRSAQAQFNLGTGLAKRGARDEALSCFESALAVKSDYAPARAGLGVLMLGKGDVGAAVDQLREAVRLRPEAADLRFNLGVALAQSRADDEAEDAFREALRLQPNYAEAHNNLGVLLQRTGRVAAAVDAYRAAVAAKPDHARAYHNLGLALASLGRKDEAIAALSESLRLNPDSQRARSDLEQLTH